MRFCSPKPTRQGYHNSDKDRDHRSRIASFLKQQAVATLGKLGSNAGLLLLLFRYSFFIITTQIHTVVILA